MNSISGVNAQKIVDQIADLSASGRVHKKPLANALKSVQGAVKNLVQFQPEQARKISCDMEKAITVLAAQKSNMGEKKAGGLRDIADHLRTCFSHSMDRMCNSMVALRQSQDNIPTMMKHQQERIENRHQSTIAEIKEHIGGIQKSMGKHESLLRQREKLDKTADALLTKSGFSEEEKRTAATHYQTPTTREIKGFEHHSSDDVFSDKEAQRRFGGDITKHMGYGRRQYVEISTKVYTPANAKGQAWVQLRQLAEQRRMVSGEMSRHQVHSGAMRTSAARVEIKAEKAAWKSELEALRTIVDEKSAKLESEIIKTGDQLSSLQAAHDALLPDETSTSL